MSITAIKQIISKDEQVEIIIKILEDYIKSYNVTDSPLNQGEDDNI